MGGNFSKKAPENKPQYVTPITQYYVPITPATPPSAPSSYGDDNPPSTNIGAPSFPATKPSYGGGVGGLPMKDNNQKEVIVFHSSNKWTEYFEASMMSNKLVVIYFTASWCGPSKYMEPTIKELAAKHTNVDIVKIDVDELYNVSREYVIQAMPTFVFMKNGQEIDRIIGAKKEVLQDKVEKHNIT